MTDQTLLHQQALVNCFYGEDGELSPSGRLVLAWIRDVACEWGDDPMAADIYDGDMCKLGERIGRQNVYRRILQEMHIAPELERIHAMETMIIRERERHEQIADDGYSAT